MLLDALSDLTESDPLVFLLIGITALAIVLAILLLIIVWPLDRVHLEDPMMHPFGDMPRVHTGFSDRELRAVTRDPHPADPLRRSFTHSHFESAGVALRSAETGGAGFNPSSPVAARSRRPDA